MGGQPEHLTTAGGAPDYERMSEEPETSRALDYLVALADSEVVAIMCSESQPGELPSNENARTPTRTARGRSGAHPSEWGLDGPAYVVRLKRIATIGFGKKGAERFVQLLESAGVSTVIDTRRRPDSPLSGYARQRDLPFILDQAGIGYEYTPELAPSDELLSQYRRDRDWTAYVRDYTRSVLDSDEAERVMRGLLSRDETVALLCSEPTPAHCHRRLAVERMAAFSSSKLCISSEVS